MSRNYDLLRTLGSKLEPLPAVHTDAVPSNHRSGGLRHVAAAVTHSSPTQNNEFEWYRALNILQRYWRSSASFAALVFLIVTFLAFIQTSVYEPTATIEIDPAGAEMFSPPAEGSGSNDTEYLETQAKNLESDELAVAVIRSLHLDQNSDFIGVSKPSLLSRLNPFYWLATSQKYSAAQASDRTASAPELSTMENVALRSFRSRLTIKRDTAGRLVMASFASHDPRLAALVTNTLVNSFIETNHKTHHDAVMQSSEWLSKQLDDIREAMKQSDRALADYERTWGIVDLGDDDKQSTFTQRISELNQQLSQAQADRIQLEAFLKRIQAGSGASLQQALNDPVIQELTRKLAEVRTELSQSVVVYGKNHPNVRKLQNQADELEARLSAQHRTIIGAIQTSYAAAQAREQLMSKEMKGATNQMNHVAQYSTLKKEAQTNRQLYNVLYTRVKEADISAESKSSNIRVVDHARVLDIPTRPQRVLIMTVGLFVGLLGGAVMAFLMEKFDTTIRDLHDIKRSTGVSAISIIPTFEEKNGSRLQTPERVFTPLGSKENYEAGAVQQFVLERPGSPEAEALRGLQTSIMLSGRGSPPQVIEIVSAFPGEGKTVLAVNLAVALSKHSKTCLLDADLRRPGIANAFGLSIKHGLGDVLLGSVSLDCVLTDLPDLKGLTILPACVVTGDPGQLFVSHSMESVLRVLRQRFQYVVIDSPPIIPFSDGRAIAPLADGLVLVGRYGLTSREAMARSIELLTQVNAAPIIEVVLNAAGHSPLERQYRYQTRS
jgi:polysaccharide biosynthesis transport protein